MRQVNLKVLRGRLTEELKNLPFEITKNGKVVGVVVEKGLTFSKEFVELHAKGLNKSAKMPTGIVNNPEEAAEKLTEIVKKKQGTDIVEATIVTGRTHFNPCPKPVKKGKKQWNKK